MVCIFLLASYGVCYLIATILGISLWSAAKICPFFLNHIYLCVWDPCMPWHTWGSERMTCVSAFSFQLVDPEIKPRLSGLTESAFTQQSILKAYTSARLVYFPELRSPSFSELWGFCFKKWLLWKNICHNAFPRLSCAFHSLMASVFFIEHKFSILMSFKCIPFLLYQVHSVTFKETLSSQMEILAQKWK